jgi:hypothetical protein
MTTMMRVRAQQLVAAFLATLLALPVRAGAPDYDAFSDRDGRITTKQHGLGLIKLVSNTVELEAVFEESRRGNARAKRVFEELETSYFPDTGRELAELVSRPPCLVPVLRELSGWCVPDWTFLDFLSKDKLGGVRLRVALLNGYMERARQRNLENQLILSATTSILGASVVANALREAGIATSVSRVPAGTKGTGAANDVLYVTPDGVVLPKGLKYKIPDRYVENPHRSGSYGEIVDGKFKERLRIDPPTPPGQKGPNTSHYHRDGEGKHYTPAPEGKDPGFQP